MQFPHETYAGPPIDNEDFLASLPVELQNHLRTQNGCIAYRGGFHLRGVVAEPIWHSLADALDGPDSFAELYPDVEPDDIPFAEEACGDQFLLRDGRVLRLYAETGELADLNVDLAGFLQAVSQNAQAVLGLEPILAFYEKGEKLEPGQLLSVLPPFCMEEAQNGVSLRAIDALERRRFLADLAEQLRDLPDGAHIELRVVE